MVKMNASMNMLKVLVCLLACIMASARVQAQATDEGKVIIKYDPLFWKDQLKLTPSQSDKIKEINIEYYEKIKVISASQPAGNNSRVTVEQFLEQRSNQIWNTFHTKQKRRWVKLWSDTKNG
jgi:hypothetical protein